jgi:predicted acetyltransferase
VRAQAFAVKESDRDRWTARVDPAEFIVAVLDDQIVGSLRVLDMGQWFAGRSVPMGGIASVVVLPEHRGEGVAARLLGASLERMREAGQPISVLHPATTRVYRAAGWEIAGDLASHQVATRALERLPRGESEHIRRLTPDDLDAIRMCYDAVASTRSGWVDRRDWLWDLLATENFVDQRFVYGVDGTDGLDGYLVFAQSESPAWGYRISVEELVARDPGAAVTLWRFLGGHGMQVEHIDIECGSIDELLLVLPEQDVKHTGNNRWMLRVVDAPAAIGSRGFPPHVSMEVHLDVTDRVAAWNQGHWILRVEGGHGELVPGGTGDVQMGVNGFSALYSGWGLSTALVAAGALHHGSATDRAALDAAFAGPPPMMIDDF